MFFTNPRKKKCSPVAGQFSRRPNEIHLLVPIQDYEQGRLAINLLRSNRNDQIKSIRLFQCIEDKLNGGGFVHAMDIIQTSDEQKTAVENALVKLQRLAEVLAQDLPSVRVSFNAGLYSSIPDAIVEEAEIINASMILFVQDPQRKRHWLFPGVSNRVLRNAPCSVQIIRPDKKEHILSQQVFVA